MQVGRRIAINLEYAGGKFHGSQLQAGVRTVQLELEHALNIFFRTGAERAIKATFSGRTDSGVHALGQIAHFDILDEFLLRSIHSGNSGLLNTAAAIEGESRSNETAVILPVSAGILPAFEDTEHPPNSEVKRAILYQPAYNQAASSDKHDHTDSVISNNVNSATSNIAALKPTSPDQDQLILKNIKTKPGFTLDDFALKKMCWALNGILPKDMSITQAQEVSPKFNARFSARRRSYVYRILNRAQRSALRHSNRYFLQARLDFDSMKQAAECLLGQHDFAAFKSSNKESVSTICLVERAEILNKGEGELEFWICADHFVYNMVRIIVGTLVEVGLGKRAPSALSEALTGKDRHLAGPTAPPWGLCLYSVDYPAEFSLFQKDS